MTNSSQCEMIIQLIYQFVIMRNEKQIILSIRIRVALDYHLSGALINWIRIITFMHLLYS